MGQKPTDDGKDKPNLEIPSLSLNGFGRKRKSPPDVPTGLQAGPDLPTEHQAAPEGSTRTVPLPAAAEPTGGRVEGRAARSLPSLPGRVAAVLTGLLVGVTGTLLTYLGMAGCDAVRGTSSCGGPGLFLLVAILAVMILLGTAALKACKVSDPAGTSFLAVGLVTVVALVAPLDVVYSVWMFLLAPIISAASYALSHWVTTRFTDEAGDGPPPATSAG